MNIMTKALFLSGAQASTCMKNVCESYLRVVNTVLSDAAAGSSSQRDADVVQPIE